MVLYHDLKFHSKDFKKHDTQIIHKRSRNQDQFDVVLNQDVPVKFEENIVKIVNISQTDNFK